jgi:hypothetical protein
MINLNDEKFDQSGSDVIIFNGGTAGLAENVTMSVDKKAADAKEGSPDYKVVFTDSNGGTCNHGLWFVTGGNDYNDEATLINKQAKLLKHLVHAVYGSDYQFPQFGNATEMLNGCMKLLKEGLPNAGQFRIWTNYGTTQGPKKYIQPRGWVPCVEPMTVPIAETRLQSSGIENMERLTEDAVFGGTPAEPASASTPAADDNW